MGWAVAGRLGRVYPKLSGWAHHFLGGFPRLVCTAVEVLCVTMFIPNGPKMTSSKFDMNPCPDISDCWCSSKWWHMKQIHDMIQLKHVPFDPTPRFVSHQTQLAKECEFLQNKRQSDCRNLKSAPQMNRSVITVSVCCVGWHSGANGNPLCTHFNSRPLLWVRLAVPYPPRVLVIIDHHLPCKLLSSRLVLQFFFGSLWSSRFGLLSTWSARFLGHWWQTEALEPQHPIALSADSIKTSRNDQMI